eukprot:CAMPEP_0170543490 /NCGR_PEP_ID=MMETSP0211-20121228/2589_1 /TAXON_ID=311385 /ORGANISM="Pseudokeronopsis sp., Strain OXSARD2" /LENGTH=87 /DNA_ID=CAMNT_0010846881 /DNA_START=596 /DNA_END=859 /DNA_ORIENTATION=-
MSFFGRSLKTTKKEEEEGAQQVAHSKNNEKENKVELNMIEEEIKEEDNDKMKDGEQNGFAFVNKNDLEGFDTFMQEKNLKDGNDEIT